MLEMKASFLRILFGIGISVGTLDVGSLMYLKSNISLKAYKHVDKRAADLESRNKSLEGAGDIKGAEISRREESIPSSRALVKIQAGDIKGVGISRSKELIPSSRALFRYNNGLKKSA
ncbi:hypothetical protein ACP275_02G114800 [Erythranthe tilingii]